MLPLSRSLVTPFRAGMRKYASDAGHHHAPTRAEIEASEAESFRNTQIAVGMVIGTVALVAATAPSAESRVINKDEAVKHIPSYVQGGQASAGDEEDAVAAEHGHHAGAAAGAAHTAPAAAHIPPPAEEDDAIHVLMVVSEAGTSKSESRIVKVKKTDGRVASAEDDE